jgi:HD-GYP domain-containing protein (c-di-GMP phosphodiesterase class II)
VRMEPFRADAWTLGADEVGILVADAALATALAARPPSGLGEAADRIGLIYAGEPGDGMDPFWSARLHFSLPAAAPAGHLIRAARSVYRVLEERIRSTRDRRALLARTSETEALVEVGIALAAETDHDVLLETILSRARALTLAEAGSLCLIEPSEAGDVLRFERAQNDAVRFDFEASILALDESSIAGFVACSGSVVNLADVRSIPADAPYRFDPAFDERYGYRTRSMLAVPMRTPQGRTLGVLQLINRKILAMPDRATTAFIRSEIVPFEESNAEIARSLAAQAAVAVENRRLTGSIRALFDGFVGASVTAIEQRDPTTSGHSQRVALLTGELAEAADRAADGPYAAFRITREELRELRYAAILHDFGKVAVREHVLVKAKKLLPLELKLVRARFDEALLAAAGELWEHAARGGWNAASVAEALAARRAELDAAWEAVVRADEPSVLPREVSSRIAAIAGLTYRDAQGRSAPLLAPDELACLTIAQGSLTPPEREEIQSHVAQTFRFLKRIPWTADLARVPAWAYAHHEKLDGSGYPLHVTAAAIPAPVRMLTICDIYDALAARDRPYKKALAPESAIEILAADARRGALDADLLAIFIEAGVWKTP